MIDLPGLPIDASDLEMLERSWITPHLAAHCQLRRVTSLEGAQLVGKHERDGCQGVVFPYFLPGDDRPREYRIRRDAPDVQYEGEKRKEKNKYFTPPGRSNLLYFLPGILPAWLQDAEIPIVIVEGEKKAIALWRLAWRGSSDASDLPRFLPIGLSGVWNWRGSIGKETGPTGERQTVKGVIPDMARVEWKDRKVIIFFDIDVKTNSSVGAARNELARYLIHERGSHVHYAEVTERKDVKAVDDLLYAVGPEKVQRIIDKAKQAQVKAKETAQSAILGRLYDGAEFFHARDGTLYATIQIAQRRETWPVRSKGFGSWLVKKYYDEEQRPPSTQALMEALAVCEARAQFDGPEIEVGIRFMPTETGVSIDLADEDWNAIDITAGGAVITSTPPAKFRRAKGMLPLCRPEFGGRIEELREYINAEDDENWILILSWLVGAVAPNGPYPLLILQGEQGSAKSSIVKVLRSLIDPAVPVHRSLPDSERDLMIAATNSWVLAFDNISGIQPWLSDAFCRLSTGGGFATRQLHSDAEETLFSATRPMIMNGIDDIATAPDLADRSLIVNLPVLPKRVAEKPFWKAFEKAKPRIVGALCEAVAMAIRELPRTRVDNLPRMADFAMWVCAASHALPFTAERFLEVYNSNRRAAVSVAIEASPVAAALQRLCEQCQEGWSGTASELLERINGLVGDEEKRSRAWPRDATRLSNRVRRVAPMLRTAGLDVQFHLEGHEKKRIIELTRKQRENSVRSVRMEGNAIEV